MVMPNPHGGDRDANRDMVLENDVVVGSVNVIPDRSASAGGEVGRRQAPWRTPAPVDAAEQRPASSCSSGRVQNAFASCRSHPTVGSVGSPRGRMVADRGSTFRARPPRKARRPERKSMMDALGSTTWVIPEGYIPGDSTGPQPQMLSHETVCLLNTGDQDAHVEITVFLADAEPLASVFH
ncbi:sensory rhodopsin transducer [Actinoplanes sp. NPDC026619]|uniref:sensory rhodopsin transducer n=1 Tax=Actinoplanes sp. NPDC026619 TaxID=3155798 RepID=UPI0033FFE018